MIEFSLSIKPPINFNSLNSHHVLKKFFDFSGYKPLYLNLNKKIGLEKLLPFKNKSTWLKMKKEQLRFWWYFVPKRFALIFIFWYLLIDDVFLHHFYFFLIFFFKFYNSWGIWKDVHSMKFNFGKERFYFLFFVCFCFVFYSWFLTFIIF